MTKLPVWEQLSVLSQKVFNRRRSLLFPMLLLALGLHAVLLALPLPSSEGRKAPDDKKNPIKITQIPTENLDANPSSKAAGITPKVAIPPIGKTPVADSSSTTDSSTTSSSATDSSTDTSSGSGDTPTSATASTSAKTSTSAKQSKKSSSPVSSSDASSSDTSSSTADNSAAGSSAPTPEASATNSSPDSTTTTSTPEPAVVASASSNAATVASPFANFPHYQPSVSDCYSLGFGENCRVVSNVAIAQVTDFFRKELAAKEFQTNLVTDEPTHKVLKVSRDNKTLFLNIWQAKQDVAYLLAGVVYKQSPEAIKTEAGK